jgi:hypothetical protein
VGDGAVSSASGTADASDGLEGLRAAVAAGNPDLYRHVALYLQVLRSVLPGRVEQACFHLATQVHVQRYLQLPASQRRELHRRLQDHVRRCTSLLTVEQLVALARRLEQDRQQQQQRRQQELLQRLIEQGAQEITRSRSAEPGGGQEVSAADSAPLPPGSVRLDRATPWDHPGLTWNLGHPGAETMTPQSPGAGGTSGSQTSEDDDDLQDPEDEESGSDQEQGEASSSEDDDIASLRHAADEAELMAALIEGLIQAGALEEGEADTDSDEGGGAVTSDLAAVPGSRDRDAGIGRIGRQVPRQGGATAGLLPAAGNDTEPEGLVLEAGLVAAGESGSEVGSPWDQPLLPQDPLLLLRWLDGVEAALARRLRNLSHAINVDLLRLGLSRGLLPVSLLEAVLQGQIETLASPSNVLRLQLPFGLRPGAPPLQAIAILLRPVDLEMEEPRLRTCRRRIHQHRQQVRKMAQTYRRLQRRLQAHEAERMWLQDIRTSRNPEA